MVSFKDLNRSKLKGMQKITLHVVAACEGLPMTCLKSNLASYIQAYIFRPSQASTSEQPELPRRASPLRHNHIQAEKNQLPCNNLAVRQLRQVKKAR